MTIPACFDAEVYENCFFSFHYMTFFRNEIRVKRCTSHLFLLCFSSFRHGGAQFRNELFTIASLFWSWCSLYAGTDVICIEWISSMPIVIILHRNMIFSHWKCFSRLSRRFSWYIFSVVCSLCAVYATERIKNVKYDVYMFDSIYLHISSTEVSRPTAR